MLDIDNPASTTIAITLQALRNEFNARMTHFHAAVLHQASWAIRRAARSRTEYVVEVTGAAAEHGHGRYRPIVPIVRGNG